MPSGPLYKVQEAAPVIRIRFGESIALVNRIVDATSLLSYSSAFIRSAGTMTAETALLGITSIFCFPSPKSLYIQCWEQICLVETIRSRERSHWSGQADL